MKKEVSKLELNVFLLLDKMSGACFFSENKTSFNLTTHQVKVLAFIVSQLKDNLDCFVIDKESKIKCAECFDCSVDSVSVAMTGLVKLGVIFKMGNSSYSVNKAIEYYDSSERYEVQWALARM